MRLTLFATFQVQLSDQAEMVKRFLEHKQLTSQLNASKEKARLDTRLAQDSNERFMQSRQRVATMKAKKAAIQVRYFSLVLAIYAYLNSEFS